MESDAHTERKRKPGLLKHQLRLVKQKPREGCKERYEIAPIEESLSFEKGFFLFIRAVQLLAQKNEGMVLVGLAGPSGAGKTVFSEKVSSFMPGVVTISMDNYNDASRVIDGNFDDPRLTDYDCLLANIEGLRQGKAVDVPIYDFKKSARVGYRRVEVPENRIVVIEGIYALSERLRPLLDMRVSVTGGVHFDLVKRVLRDIDRSGQEPEGIIQQISETVYPMYKAFIEPDLKTAHLRIVNKFNPFSGFQNATYILKSAEPVSEASIRDALGPGAQEASEETYDIYLLPPGEDRDTCQSYLRMRNRAGKYSLMFEEWVTDGPFIISPRITFEVSVRLLGGLMALGYEMASILKRDSRVFSAALPLDGGAHSPRSSSAASSCVVTVKLDQLEQLHRTYVQVQGRDRRAVQEVAEKLHMQRQYVPRSYIEQIQLEQLTQEVMSVPEELKERLGGGLEDMSTSLASSPHSLPAHFSTNKLQMLRSRSLQVGRQSAGSASATPATSGQAPSDRRFAEEPPPLSLGGSSSHKDAAQLDRLEQHLHASCAKLDTVLARLSRLEAQGSREPPEPREEAQGREREGQSAEAQGVLVPGVAGSVGCNGHVAARAGEDGSVAEQLQRLIQGQRHLSAQLDSVVRKPDRERAIAGEGKRRPPGDRAATLLAVGAAGLLAGVVLGLLAVSRGGRLSSDL